MAAAISPHPQRGAAGAAAEVERGQGRPPSDGAATVPQADAGRTRPAWRPGRTQDRPVGLTGANGTQDATARPGDVLLSDRYSVWAWSVLRITKISGVELIVLLVPTSSSWWSA